MKWTLKQSLSAAGGGGAGALRGDPGYRPPLPIPRETPMPRDGAEGDSGNGWIVVALPCSPPWGLEPKPESGIPGPCGAGNAPGPANTWGPSARDAAGARRPKTVGGGRVSARPPARRGILEDPAPD